MNDELYRQQTANQCNIKKTNYNCKNHKIFLFDFLEKSHNSFKYNIYIHPAYLYISQM